MDVLLRYVLFGFLGIIPVLIWAGLYFSYDSAKKEPRNIILRAFAVGAYATLPVFLLYQIWKFFVPQDALSMTIFGVSLMLLLRIIVVAFLEEMSKHVGALFVMFSDKEAHNEVSDAVLYAITVALGFSFIENILYVREYILDGSISTVTMIGYAVRGMMTMFAHTVFSSIFGIFFAYAQVKGGFSWKNALQIVHPKHLLLQKLREVKKTPDQIIFNQKQSFDIVFEGMWFAVFAHVIFNVFLTIPFFLETNLYALLVPLYLFFIGRYVFSAYKKLIKYH